ncbi:MAG: hypothetical protein M3P51_11800 [Chloroflexota bacterium]|nr:hypothetical protein [Chloroflexota bacterium]
MLRVAGDLPRHITMAPRGERKYIERPNRRHPGPAPVTPDMLRRHLDGRITLGSWLANPDGTTWAVVWDADDAERWKILLMAGRQLLVSAAKPSAERSPVKGEHAGGGHLWLVFREPMDPRAARATAEKHAPELESIREFWPHAGAVRLLGGYYRRGETSAWCEATALRRPEGWVRSWDAAALASFEAMSSGWVTEPAPPGLEDDEVPYTPPTQLDTRELAHPEQGEPEAWRDLEWIRRYGAARHSLPWAVLPKHAINWFNSLHDVRTILPKQSNGYALATWRGERTASVAYLPDNRWRDYGGNRTQPGGDAFEAYALVTYGHGGRDRALADVCRQMTAMAWRELEAAARSNRGLPAWVAEIMAPEGWRRYERLRASESADRHSQVRNPPKSVHRLKCSLRCVYVRE